MQMIFCPLYSGSSGNALFVQAGNTRLLIDAGKSGKCIREALLSIGVDPATLNAILVTHEHSDHIAGVGVLCRKYHIPVLANAPTWNAMARKVGEIPPGMRLTFDSHSDFYLGDIGVAPFLIPHDAAEPVGFRLYHGALSISTATDLGRFTKALREQLSGSNLVLLESNHDPDMLRRNEPLLRRAEGAHSGQPRTPEQRCLRRRGDPAGTDRRKADHPGTPERGKQPAGAGPGHLHPACGAGRHDPGTGHFPGFGPAGYRWARSIPSGKGREAVRRLRIRDKSLLALGLLALAALLRQPLGQLLLHMLPSAAEVPSVYYGTLILQELLLYGIPAAILLRRVRPGQGVAFPAHAPWITLPLCALLGIGAQYLLQVISWLWIQLLSYLPLGVVQGVVMMPRNLFEGLLAFCALAVVPALVEETLFARRGISMPAACVLPAGQLFGSRWGPLR